jgi:hypothetical protein
MGIRRTGTFGFVITSKCAQCRNGEFRRGTGWPTTAGEICGDCQRTGQTIEDLAGMRPVNQHWG